MAEVNMGTLYDWNKSAMEQLKPLSEVELKDKMRAIREDFFITGRYYMLLCHECRDYTILTFIQPDFAYSHSGIEYTNGEFERKKMANELKECLQNRGNILSIEKQPDGAWEIWIRNTEGVFCYYFFPYDQGVIECQKGR